MVNILLQLTFQILLPVAVECHGYADDDDHNDERNCRRNNHVDLLEHGKETEVIELPDQVLGGHSGSAQVG